MTAQVILGGSVHYGGRRAHIGAGSGGGGGGGVAGGTNVAIVKILNILGVGLVATGIATIIANKLIE